MGVGGIECPSRPSSPHRSPPARAPRACCWAVAAWRRRHRFAGTSGALLGLLLLTVSALFVTVALAVEGYRALTHEEIAAVVRTKPTGEQRFDARLEFADGRIQRFDLRGDQLYVDARILKWHPWANLFGLHTAYELDRLGGRYESIWDERRKPRTLYEIARHRSVDAFSLRQEWDWLAPLVDAEYGSATFIAATRPATYEVRVSTTGLLVREVDDAL